ncbi:MAG: rhamnulokinase [Actinobacteria bacterium]|nr:rhamnulokinase [Actinomycetota bacterium]
MALKNYLIFDFGASNGRAIVAKFNGSKFDLEVTHRFDNRPVYVTGTLYWDILRLFSELKIGISASQKDYGKIESLGIDTWGVDFGFIDKNGHMLSNPHHYRDEARTRAADFVHKDFSREKLFELTGGLVMEIMSLYHLYNLKINKAVELTNAYKFLMMPDLFNYFLTGNAFNEFTDATTTLTYDQKNKKWSDKILNKLGISKDLFPEIIQPGSKVGDIQKSILDELEIANIPVIAPASHDSASAETGIPVIEAKKNWAFVSMGTWLVEGIETPEPVITHEAFKSGYGNEGGCEGRNLFVKNINGLWIIQQCMEKWRKDKGKNIAWPEIDEIYPKAKPFYAFINVDDPVFLPPSADMSKVIARYCREKGQNIPEGIGAVARCFYESLVLKIKNNILLTEKLTGKKIELVQLVGGGTNNKLICQWISNAVGVPVAAGPTETTAVGNLLMQLKGTGEIKDVNEGRILCRNSSNVLVYEPEEKAVWDAAYEKYVKIL